MRERIQVIWYVADGYVGQRPQYMTIWLSEVKGMNEDEVRDYIIEEMDRAMVSEIYPEADDLDGTVAEIMSMLSLTDDDEEE